MEDKKFEFVRDERGLLSIKIIRDEKSKPAQPIKEELVEEKPTRRGRR